MMNRRVLSSCALSVALALPVLLAQDWDPPSLAQQLTSSASQDNSQITGVKLVPDGDQLRLQIDLAAGKRPQVFFTQQGNAWVGDITNAELRIGSGGTFRQNAPAAGISYLEAKQVGSDSVRLQIMGEGAPPQGLLTERSATSLAFDFEVPAGSTGTTVAAAPPAPSTTPPLSTSTPGVTAPALTSTGSETSLSATGGAPDALGSPAMSQSGPEGEPETVATAATPVAPELPLGVAPDRVTQIPRIDELSAPQLPTSINDSSLSQFTGAAQAPPSGDIAVGSILPTQATVDLGSDSTITLTLKDAPVADVLSLLIRRAGLNVVLNDVPADLTISLDVQDSPLQETFNFILRLKELQAERVDQTVFIGTELPGVTEQIVRSFRLNQASVQSGDEGAGVLDFLTSLSAAGGVLEGVQFIPDERTNSITAIGSAEQLDVVAAQIAQLDIRKRQALISVRVVDVTLTDTETLAVRLGGTSGNFAISGANGAGANFDGTPVDQPVGNSTGNIGVGEDGAGSNTFVFNTLNRLEDALGLRVEAALTNSTAKILADPKLVVSDGGSSTVNIGNDVIAGVAIQSDPATGLTAVVPVIETAGVNVALNDVRIDDNGFITVSIVPEVSAPAGTATFSGNTITLLNTRQLDVQRVRLRDGETFVLAGLINENDTVSVTQVPLLGSIPILGSLFRDQSTTTTRNEVVLLVTPFILNDQVASLP